MFKVTPGTQVSESWTVNELLHYRDEINWKTISYHLERVWGDSRRESRRRSIFLSFNSFPCFNLCLCHLEHSVPLPGFIIWTVHIFFKHALFDLCSKCCAETTSFSGLTLSERLSMIRNCVSCQSKVTVFSHAWFSVLPHNSSRWQLESSVLLLCVGSHGGENVLLFIQWTFRVICMNGLLEKVLNLLATLHKSDLA